MKHYKKKSKNARILISILIALIVAGTVCIGLYMHLQNNKSISVTLGEGDFYSLSELTDNKSKVKIKDDSILSLCDDMALTALKEGETSVVIRNGFDIKVCNFKVVAAPKSISMQESIILNQGTTKKLNAVCMTDSHRFSLTYSSSDESVATVNHDGTVVSNSIGSCQIKAEAYNGISAVCNVTVINLPYEFDILTLERYNVDTNINIILDTEFDIPSEYITTTVSDSDVLLIDNENPKKLYAAKEGTASITVTLTNGASVTKTVTVGEYSGNSIEGFEILNQFPTLPTGCEVVSLTSVLNFYGMYVSMTTMADDYMPRSTEPYYFVDPDEYFIGTPYTWDGFGCYPGTIVKTAENYFNANNIDDYKVVNITGCSVQDIFNYIENGIPVITWGTSNFATPQWDAYWDIGDKRVSWCNYEHCLVTAGYDINSGTVTLADDSGGYFWDVSISQYRTVFEGMNSMAVVVLPK